MYVFGLVFALCTGSPVAAQEAAPAPAYELADVYVGLRGSAMARAGAGPADAAPGKVVGVLMDWALDQAVATQMCADDGSVSLYFSHGGGAIGIGETPEVRKACAALIEAAPAAMGDLKRVSEAPSVPRNGQIQFIVVTKTGLWAATAERKALLGSHALTPLFRESDKLTTSIRLAMQSQ